MYPVNDIGNDYLFSQLNKSSSANQFNYSAVSEAIREYSNPNMKVCQWQCQKILTIVGYETRGS